MNLPAEAVKTLTVRAVLFDMDGTLVDSTAIVEQVWHLNFDTMTNVVDVYINYLRRKLDTGASHPLIRTIRGVGYQIGSSQLPA